MGFTVLMSAYINCRKEYISCALSSIWHDQIRKPDQIVLVLDGPVKEELYNFVQSFAKQIYPAMVITELSESRGLSNALNHGIAYCDHEFVTRMDSDDIALPTRFIKQVSFMEDHPEIAASSSLIEEFDEYGTILGIRALPFAPEDVFMFAKFRCPLSHPASIFRKSIVQLLGGYPDLYPEDHALWSLMLQKGYKLANMEEVLLRMRMDSSFIHRRGWRLFSGEMQLIAFQRRIHFLTNLEAFANIILRIILRLPPAFFRLWLYRMAKSKK